MADRWMDERDREWRERDWRRSEEYGRGGSGRDEDRGRAHTWGEDRTWSGAADDDRGPYADPSRNRRDYGEGGQAYGGSGVGSSGGAYGGGEAYGRGAGGRPQGYRSGPARQGGGFPRFATQDYTRGLGQGGRGDYDYDYDYEARERRMEEDRHPGPRRGGWSGGEAADQYYGQGEFERRAGRADPRNWERDRDRDYGREASWRHSEEPRESLGGGYGYERSSGQEGRSDERRGDWDERRGEAAEFLHRAGERISSWFRGDNFMRGSQEEDERREEPRRYREDYGREARAIPERGHRGVGPKGYRRSDERISDEVHERLTDDPWLDASNIEVQVKDGEVTLSGTVDNREGKHRAERLVEDLSGVRHVQNNLRIEPNATFTGAGRGFGSSALEAEMRRNEAATGAGNNGASGLSGRTSTGALAERSTGTASDVSPGDGKTS